MPSWKDAMHPLLILVLVWTVGCAESRRYAPPQPPASAASILVPADHLRAAAPAMPVYPAAQHRVARVRDGDSLTLLSDEVKHEVRLSGIDAPELRQEFGPEAKAELAALVHGKQITFADVGRDPYHRTLVRLYADGIDVNLELVRRGLAWQYRAYSDDRRIDAAEREARRFRRGLWAQPNPQPPWEWRRVNARPTSSGGG